MIMFMILAIMALSLVGINSPKCPKCKVPMNKTYKYMTYKTTYMCPKCFREW